MNGSASDTKNVAQVSKPIASAEDLANGWQPARLVNFHADEGGPVDEDAVQRLAKKTVRVRPYSCRTESEAQWRRKIRGSCDSQNFYQIHIQDDPKYSVACEHEVLTD